MKRQAARRPAQQGRSGLPPRQVLLRLVSLCAWAAALGGAAYGLYRLEPVALRAQANVSPRLVWCALPPWLSKSEQPEVRDVLDELTQAADLLSTDDIRDAALVDRVAAGLRRCAWVADVRRVAKQSDGVVRVDATFREPLTMIVSGSRAYLVDARGVRLPRETAAADVWTPAYRAYFPIVGASHPVPEVGAQWNGEDVAAGLRLVQFLTTADRNGQMVYRPFLRSVDVSNYESRKDPVGGKLSITTIDPRGLIRWGAAPGDEAGLERSAELKLGALLKSYNDFGGRLPVEGWIDVRWKDLIKYGPTP